MKTIKQIKEAYDVVTNKEQAEDRKLSSLVEFGLLDANKLPALKESLNKPVEQMSAQEKRMFVNLLESIISEMQVRRTVDFKDYYSTPDPRVKRAGYPSQKEAPSVLLLKRKAIRVFPDGQKVALYYAQAIDKYVSIPYNEIGINEVVDANRRNQTVDPDNQEDDSEDDSENGNNSSSRNNSDARPWAKASTPMKSGKATLSVGAPGNPQDVRIRTSIDSYMERLQRQANRAMAQQNEAYAGTAPTSPGIDWTEIAKKAAESGISMGKEMAKRMIKARIQTLPGARIASAYIDMIQPAGSKQEREWELENVKKQRAKTSSRALAWPGAGTTGLGNIAGKKEKAETSSRALTWNDIKPIAVPKKSQDVAGASDAEAAAKARAGNDLGYKDAVKAANVKGPSQAVQVPASRKDIPSVRYVERELEREAERKKADAKTRAATAPTVITPADSISSPESRIKSTEKAIKKTQDIIDTRTRTDARAVSDAEAGTLAAVASRRSQGPRTRGRQRGRGKGLFPDIKLNMPPKKALQPMDPNLKLSVAGPTGKPHTALDAADLIKSRNAMLAQARMEESVDLDGNIFALNNKVTEKVKTLYESLNKKNKKKMIDMMNESAESLEKVISFAVRQ